MGVSAVGRPCADQCRRMYSRLYLLESPTSLIMRSLPNKAGMAKISTCYATAASFGAAELKCYSAVEQKHLHCGASSKCMDDASCARIDFRGRLAYLTAGDPLNFFPQRAYRVSKQLLVVLPQVGGSLGTPGQRLLGRRERLVKCDYHRVLTDNDCDVGWCAARLLQLENFSLPRRAAEPGLIRSCPLCSSLGGPFAIA